MRARQQGGGRQTGEREASAVGKNGWISDGVAYIETKGFPGNEATLADVRQFLAAHREAKALIIDARGNGGGGLDEMNLIFREIFAEPTTLVTMDIRQAVEEKRGTPFGEDPTLRKVSGPATIVRREHFVTPATDPSPLRNAKVYLLTSKNTFSAAEHLSLSLKRTGRAVLIGEATGGGAHFGGMIPMGEGYAAFIPVGRTFDPDTGQSWEGVGVKPDVDVPADEALAEALRRVGANVDAKVAIALLKK
jgi:C-terminal processing protease CtpA/Prc